MRLRWKLKREFTIAGEEMGLRYEEDAVADQLVLRGVREGILVEARVPLGGAAAGWVSARPEGLNPEIQLKDLVGRSLLHGQGRELLSKQPDDIKIGDPHFDALVVVEGPHSELYAALTQPARAAIVTLLAHDGFVLKAGQLQIALTDRDGNWMRRDFSSLLRAAQHFVFLEGRAARLLSNYRSERNPKIALRNGACLLGEYAGSPEAAEITELLLTEGPQRFAASAGSFLEWRELLATLLVRRPRRTAPLVDDLLTVVQDQEFGPNWPELAAIAMTLRSLEPPVARPLLWKMLESNLPHSVRIVAALSMGRVGEVGDVQRLRELPTVPFTKMQEAINGAVELIQGRVEGDAGGGLALVEGVEEAGGLTIASTEGALSEPDEDIPS